jgi:hypothetical protein
MLKAQLSLFFSGMPNNGDYVKILQFISGVPVNANSPIKEDVSKSQ